MQRTPQSPDGSSNSTVEVRFGRDDDSGGESGGVEVMLSVEDERDVKGFDD